MTDFLKSQSLVEVLADLDPSLHVSAFTVEAMADLDPSFHVSTVWAESLQDNDPTFIKSVSWVESMQDNDPYIRVTQYHLEVLVSTRDAVSGPIPPRRKTWMPRDLWYYREREFLHHLLASGIQPPPPLTHVEEGTTDHWWYDIELGGFWPLQYASVDFDPQSILAYHPLGDDDKSEVILGCADGYARQLDRTLFLDDGFTFTSKVMIGPFRTGTSSMTVGLVEWLQGVLTQDSGDVEWELRVAMDYEDAALEATAAVASGTWTTGVNTHARPRRRGIAYSILITNGEADDGWSIEEVGVMTSARGRRRYIS